MTEDVAAEPVGNEAGSKVDPSQQAQDGDAKKSEGEFNAKEAYEKLKAENEELKSFAKQAAKRAADAEAFTQNVTDRMNEMAARSNTQPPADPNEMRERLRERMNEDPVGVLD